MNMVKKKIKKTNCGSRNTDEKKTSLFVFVNIVENKFEQKKKKFYIDIAFYKN